MKTLKKTIIYILIVFLPSCYTNSILRSDEFVFSEHKDYVKKVKLNDSSEVDFSNDPPGFSRLSEKGIVIFDDSSKVTFLDYKDILTYYIEKPNTLKTILWVAGIGFGLYLGYAISTFEL